MVLRALMQGLLAFVLVGGVYFWGLSLGLADNGVRALTFLALVLVIVSLIFANRSFGTSLRTAVMRPNKALVWVLLLVGTTLTLALFVPAIRDLFRFGPVEPVHVAVDGRGRAGVVGAGRAVQAVSQAAYENRRRVLKSGGDPALHLSEGPAFACRVREGVGMTC